MYLQESKLNTKNVIERRNRFFSFINFTFVTRKWEYKSGTIKLVTQKWSFLFFNLELETRKRKNKSLTIELVTWSEIKYFSISS